MTDNNVERDIVKIGVPIDTIKKNRDIIHYITTGKLDKLKEVINNVNVNDIIVADFKLTAFNLAVNTDFVDIIKYLEDCGADPKL
jgi:hypothetical protein